MVEMMSVCVTPELVPYWGLCRGYRQAQWELEASPALAGELFAPFAWEESCSEMQRSRSPRGRGWKSDSVLEKTELGSAPDAPFLSAAMVILDPDTAHPSLVVSENRRSVKWRGLQQDIPDNPERFDCETCVLGWEGFASGRHYWEVEVGGGRTWAVGVAKESVRRKGWIKFSPEERIWAVDQCGSHYRACTRPDMLLPLTGSPGKIGVYLDDERGLVSFYQLGIEAPIYIFTSSFTGQLHPFFWVYSPITLCP
ncbi:unnamed protein product [Lepidochelys kempii]